MHTQLDATQAGGPDGVSGMIAGAALQAIGDNHERTEIQYYLHSLTGEAAESRRRLLECMIHSSNNGLEDIGFLIHALGDTFAHSYYPSIKWHGKLVPQPETLYPLIVGHFFQGHTPDHISNDPEKYLAYVSALDQALPSGSSYNAYYDDDLLKNYDLLDNLKNTVRTKLIQAKESGMTDDNISSYDYNTVTQVSGYNTTTIGYNPDPNAGKGTKFPSLINPPNIINDWHKLLVNIKQTITSGVCCGK